MSVELVIVGGGNMGAALLGGMIAAGSRRRDLGRRRADRGTRATELARRFPGVTIGATVPPCAAAVIAVKPPDVPTAVASAVAAGATRVLSIAAGVSIATIQEAAGSSAVAVVRAMPNTPALVGEGASAIAGGATATDDDLEWAEGVLGAVGTVARVDESDLDAVTALSGSGPAYLFLVAEALIDAGVSVGLDPSLAEALTTQLFVGAAALLADRGEPGALREMVTSPGGTTAAGLAVLDDREVRTAFRDAVQAAAARSAELGAR